MTYARSAPGPGPTLVIIIVATVLMLVDHRRLKRARARNEEGRCARCGNVLVGPAHRVPVAGGPRFVRTGYVCDACEAKVKLQERIVWSLLAATIVIVLVMEWKRTHP
jgi:hypothetical protein